MLRRTLLTGAAVAAAASTLSLPAFAQSAGKRVLKYVPQSDVTVLDPVVTTAYITRHHAYLIWDQLYGLDENLKPQPQMVEGHTVDNGGLTWTFTLRDGLKFHDGSPVRGVDCVASIQRWAKRDALGQVMMSRVAEMTAPSDKTFVIRLNKPFGPLLDALAKAGPPALFIMPERLAKTDPSIPIKEMIGSGPFKWVAADRIVGSRAVYERNADYVPRANGTVSWAAGPKIVHFDRVEWNVMPDPGTAAAALTNNEVDWWENPTNDLLPIFKNNKKITVENIDPLGKTGTGVFNHLQAPFNNPGVRRAVLSALSQADFMSAVAGDDPKLWNAKCGIFTPGTPLANDADLSAISHKVDLAKSRQMLKDAGYKGERVVLMAASDNQVLNGLGEVCNDLLTKIGMKVDYQVADWGTVVQRRASKKSVDEGGWSMFNTTWSGLDTSNPAVHPTIRANGEQAWFGWPTDEKLEQSRLAWFDAPDLDAQKKLARDMQTEAFEQAIYLPTGQYFSSSAYSSNLKGMVKGIIAFWNLQRA